MNAVQEQVAALEASCFQLREALAKTVTILKTQEKKLGTVGLSVIALAESLIK